MSGAAISANRTVPSCSTVKVSRSRRVVYATREQKVASSVIGFSAAGSHKKDGRFLTPSAQSARATRSPTTSSFPTTWSIANYGTQSRVSKIASTRSTISAPAVVHGSRFDITTGAVINGPATEALKAYEVPPKDSFAA